MKELPADYRMGKKPLPVGNSDWADIARNCYLVDKTLLIKELLDDHTAVALFTRPRRFGKTTAMQMLKTFFENGNVDNSALFSDKAIWSAGEAYRKHQGAYPVIYLTFKDQKGRSWDDALYYLREAIAGEAERHAEALSAMIQNPGDKAKIERVLQQTASAQELSSMLRLLAQALHAYCQVKPVILIDEYDTPISSAVEYGYYDQMVSFMRVFLSGGLKDNAHCQMGVLTGILHVAKEGIFSGLNNLKVYSVFDSQYSAYFGLTEDEVAAMASYYGVSGCLPEIKHWYDGYNFGGREIYNPWSVLRYFENNCLPQAYWINTSSNDIIRSITDAMPHEKCETLKQLLEGKAVAVKMTLELGSYKQLQHDGDALYALLVSTGYLKPVSDIELGCCEVQIPNCEIYEAFMAAVRR